MSETKHGVPTTLLHRLCGSGSLAHGSGYEDAREVVSLVLQGLNLKRYNVVDCADECHCTLEKESSDGEYVKWDDIEELSKWRCK